MTENTHTEALPHLATIERAAQIFADAGETPSAIRANIFKSADRYNSRGDKIPGNGLEATGAIIRRGRKVLIDIDRYGAWLAGKTANLTTACPLRDDKLPNLETQSHASGGECG